MPPRQMFFDVMLSSRLRPDVSHSPRPHEKQGGYKYMYPYPPSRFPVPPFRPVRQVQCHQIPGAFVEVGPQLNRLVAELDLPASRSASHPPLPPTPPLPAPPVADPTGPVVMTWGSKLFLRSVRWDAVPDAPPPPSAIPPPPALPPATPFVARAKPGDNMVPGGSLPVPLLSKLLPCNALLLV